MKLKLDYPLKSLAKRFLLLLVAISTFSCSSIPSNQESGTPDPISTDNDQFKIQLSDDSFLKRGLEEFINENSLLIQGEYVIVNVYRTESLTNYRIEYMPCSDVSKNVPSAYTVVNKRNVLLYLGLPLVADKKEVMNTLKNNGIIMDCRMTTLSYNRVVKDLILLADSGEYTITSSPYKELNLCDESLISSYKELKKGMDRAFSE